MKRFALLLAVLLLPLALPVAASADVIEVKLKLPVKPKLKITGDEKIAIAPFIIASKGERKTDRAAKVDVQSEFNRYLKKQLTKSTKLRVVDVGRTQLPGNDIKSLAAARDYWKEIGARTGADYIVTGIVDFDINDKSGYKTEEYTSPADGRTFYRQVLVESTGFVFDIDLAVFNAETGEQVLEENFRDFKEFDQRNYDEILGLFENLRALEAQLVGIFVAQETSGIRYVFTQ
jgi:TolB-like protein